MKDSAAIGKDKKMRQDKGDTGRSSKDLEIFNLDDEGQAEDRRKKLQCVCEG